MVDTVYCVESEWVLDSVFVKKSRVEHSTLIETDVNDIHLNKEARVVFAIPCVHMGQANSDCMFASC